MPEYSDSKDNLYATLKIEKNTPTPRRKTNGTHKNIQTSNATSNTNRIHSDERDVEVNDDEF